MAGGTGFNNNGMNSNNNKTNSDNYRASCNNWKGKSPYETLKVTRSNTKKEIEKIYRKLMLGVHSDKYEFPMKRLLEKVGKEKNLTEDEKYELAIKDFLETEDERIILTEDEKLTEGEKVELQGYWEKKEKAKQFTEAYDFITKGPLSENYDYDNSDPAQTSEMLIREYIWLKKDIEKSVRSCEKYTKANMCLMEFDKCIKNLAGHIEDNQRDKDQTTSKRA